MKDPFKSINSPEHTDQDITDPKKRQTLKIMTAVGATGLLSTQVVHAVPDYSTASPNCQVLEPGKLDCTLITKPGDSLSHLLMSNPTDNDIVIKRFNSALIQFDNGSMSRSNEPYSTPVIVPAFGDIMVEFKLIPGLQTNVVPANIVNLESTTRYLPERTRVSTFTAIVVNGVAEIRRFGAHAASSAVPA